MDTIKAWFLLTRIKGLGYARIKSLLDYYQDIPQIFQQTSFPEHLNLPKSVQQSLKNPNLDSSNSLDNSGFQNDFGSKYSYRKPTFKINVFANSILSCT